MYKSTKAFFPISDDFDTKQQLQQNLQLKSPDKPHEKLILNSSPNGTTSVNTNLLMPNNSANLNATNSTQSSNFYENTMHSDTSSLQKRKSVISSQSTGSSNEVKNE